MIRLTGGKWRGHSLYTPHAETTRPTQSKLRQALFNTLQAQIPGAIVLDLFSGSGSLAFEALSRGAQSVTCVEHSKPALQAIRANAEQLKVGAELEISPVRVENFRPKSGFVFDLVLADPPYQKGWEFKLLAEILQPQWFSPGAVAVLESSSRDLELPERIGGWSRFRLEDYGDTRLTHFRLTNTAAI